jgi:imidazolonepropionase-like amidohydrolase
MKRTLFVLLLCGIGSLSFGQKYFPVNGVADERPDVFAFTNATIYVDHLRKIDNATLVIRDGRVAATGTNITIPSEAKVYDLKGKAIYPAFIDPYTSYGIPEVKSGNSRGRGPQLGTMNQGAFGWNESIKAEYDAIDEFTIDDKSAKSMRAAGFGAVLSHRMDGVHRGSSVFASLGNLSAQESVIKPRAGAHLSFDKGSSRQEYPSSIMGMSALIRQTFLNAQWYERGGDQEMTNESLAAVNGHKGLPHFFEANSDKLRVLLADKLGDEAGIQFVIKGNGDEYQRIEDIKKTNASLIIPLNFPDAYDVDDPLESIYISLADLKHWELAPHNPRMLAESGVTFAFTAHGLKKSSEYINSVRKAVESGLTKSAALQAMTVNPAKMTGVSDQLGTLDKGKRANFFISSGDIFDEESPIIYQTWIDGVAYENKSMDSKDHSGQYDLSIDGKIYQLHISGEAGSNKAKIVVNDTTDLKVNFIAKGNSIQFSFTPEEEGLLRLSGWSTEKGLAGTGVNTSESWFDWIAVMAQDESDSDSENEEPKEEGVSTDVGDIIYPFIAHGWTSAPKQEDVIFKNATVWTMENDGIMEEADVLVSGGKIKAVGKELSIPSGTRVIDASGLHLTPGIIDEHSHIALSGVNEGSNVITAEVRMYDAVDSEDIDIYRQLSGGVVAAQLLHGSANPVGGQSALIKFRWGLSPEKMFIKGADEYIKFALGENVKQSNWGDDNTIRFPQTRMGVEQVFVDGFTRAVEYDAEWKAYNALSKKQKAIKAAPRRDLQLEALAEIVNKERFISCHSYVQSEINMLMKVAEQFGFNVNTFTHILEGYKVADKMAAHGAGGSTFSDWWAYKNEVKDAIPYNAAIMHKAGVTVAINSDDAEMARRLNQEAAKTIKYGAMDEYEAMKMVTINPAKLLHLDDRMGSIKVGKDADLVLWSSHPLSINARSKITMIDGAIYFDEVNDLALRDSIREEKARIIKKMKGVKKAGGKTTRYQPKERHVWDCEEFEIEE